MALLVYILLISTSIHSLNALKCYICSATEDDQERRCFDRPEELELRNCNKNYCTSVRQEYLDPKDRVKAISRGCMDDLGRPNGVVEDGENRFYYKSCQEDRCNGGTGKDISGSGIVKDQGYGVIFVPGFRSGSRVTIASIGLLLTCFVGVIV